MHPHFGSHLDFFRNFNDVSLLPFRIHNSNMSFKRIKNAKLLVYTKHLLHKLRSLSEKNLLWWPSKRPF